MTATLTTTVTARQDGEPVTGSPRVDEDVPCWLGKPTAAEVELAAARGVTLSQVLKVPLGTYGRVGTLAAVSGQDADRNEWTRSVRVTSTDIPDELHRLWAVVDQQLNQ